MSADPCVTRVETILADAQKLIEAVAEDYRREVLVPLCRRRRLTFLSGNGMCVFYKEDGTSVSADWECERYGMEYLKPIFAVLNTTVFGGEDCLGYYVRDVGSKR